MPDESDYLLEAEAVAQPPVRVAQRRIGHVLVVDDDEDVLVTLAAVLRAEGHDVVGVSRGQEAVEVIQGQQFDVLVVDLRLGDLDGLSVLSAATREQPDLIGIVLTGYGSLQSAVEALDAGAFSYLLKPCNLDQLKAAVLRGLNKRAMAEALRSLQQAATLAVEDRAEAEVRDARAREEEARETAARAADRVRHLQAITAQLARYMEPDALLQQVVRAAAQLLDSPIAAVFLLPKPDADFELAAAEGLDPSRSMRLPRQRSLGSETLLRRMTLAVDDVRTMPDIVLPVLASGKSVGSIVVAPIWDDQTPLGVIEVYTPSARKWTEDQIDLLSSLAAAAGIALVSARVHDELQRATRTRDEVLVSVTHDLKTPLTTISGVAQLLRRQASAPTLPPADGRLVSGLETIHKMADTMASLIDELMDAVRLQYGEDVALDLSPVDICHVVAEVVHDYKATEPDHSLQLEMPDSLILEGDAKRIRRLVDNLVSNAIKYSPQGGQVNLSIARRGSDAVLTVQDVGIGISPDDLPFLFEPFKRGANTAGIAGNGVGLLSVKRIVDLHGGSVEVQSLKGQGANFTVRLPLFQVKPAVPEVGDGSKDGSLPQRNHRHQTLGQPVSRSSS